MGPDSLRQLSPSVDREALRAQRKAGSKRADGGVRHNRRLSPVQTRFTSSTPPRFRGVFEWAVPFRLASRGELGSNCCQFTLFYTPALSRSFLSDPSHIARTAGTNWDQFVGDSPPQPTVVPLFRPRTWAPFRCGSWVPLTTERRHGLSVRPDQNEQTTASVRTFDPAGALLLTDIWPNVFNSSSPTRCLSPPAKHSRFDSRISPWVQFIWRSCAVSADSFLRTSCSPVPRPRGPSPQVHG